MSRTIAHTAMTVILWNEKSESPHFFQTASALFLALQGPGKLKGLKIKKEVEYSTFVTESIRTMYREMEHFIVPCFFMVVVLAINSICGIRNGTLILVTVWLFLDFLSQMMASNFAVVLVYTFLLLWNAIKLKKWTGCRKMNRSNWEKLHFLPR